MADVEQQAPEEHSEAQAVEDYTPTILFFSTLAVLLMVVIGWAIGANYHPAPATSAEHEDGWNAFISLMALLASSLGSS